jgi:anti-sigma factor RsiW
MMGGQDPELSDTIRKFTTRYAAPLPLRERVTTIVRAAEPPRPAAGHARSGATWWPWVSMGAVFASGAVAAWTLAWFLGVQNGMARLSDDLVADHVRSLMVAHLTDVASSDKHTVKPWFSGKLDHTPPVRDLAEDGFPLVGGRLDYLDGRSVAALVYRHGLHTINLFVWPCGDTATTGLRMQIRRGYNIVSWCDGRMQFWAVSDVNEDELKTFSYLLRQDAEEQPVTPTVGGDGKP